jgi:hypothetical protein
VDNDCDGTTDVGATDASTWYGDTDGDGAGDPAVTLTQCTQPAGYVAVAGDQCPSDSAKTTPGTCGCGTADTDADSDGLLDCLTAEDLPSLGDLEVTGNAIGDEFGASISLDGTVAAIGLPLDDHSSRTNAGSVRIYRRTGSAWTLEAQVFPPSPVTGDFFGRAVGIHGDVLVVGAPGLDASGKTDCGGVFVYRRGSDGSWALEQSIQRPTPGTGASFGQAVAVRGSFLALGTPFANSSAKSDSGEVMVMRFNGSSWVTTATRSGEPVTVDDHYGSSVALGGSEAAPTLVVGAPGDDEGGVSNCGAILVHGISSTGLIQSTARLVSPSPLSGARLGSSVTVNDAGTVVAGGAPLADTAAGVDSGAVTLCTLVSGSWGRVELVPVDRVAGEQFGAAVALRGDGMALVAGSPNDTVGGIAGRGTAVVMTRLTDGSWRTHDRLALPSGGTSASAFGTAVAIDAETILVGAPKHTPPAGGAVRLFASPTLCDGTDTDDDGLDDCSDLDDDGDGTPDSADGCPRDANKLSPGTCGCGVADIDTDGDLTLDCNDGCPNDINKTTPGACGCGVVDADSDSDGTSNCNDGCPNDPNKVVPGACGCGVADTDSDSDGTPDCNDGCPNDANKLAPGTCGCGVADTDSDSDGTPNCNDGCPTDGNKTSPGTCGCGVADTDGDGDGTLDCVDGCPSDPNKIAEGACGCGTPDSDGDGDGTADCIDGCPSDATKTSPGQCGCGNPDTDTDSDGTADCVDGCPADADKTAPGICGCGVADTDTDVDGVADCQDNCVAIANPAQADCNSDDVGDACEIAAGVPDCHGDGIPDSCQGLQSFEFASGQLGPIGSGSSQSVSVTGALRSTGDVTLDFSAVANLAGVTRFMLVSIDGGTSQVIFNGAEGDCPATAATTTLVIPRATWNAAAEDGTVSIQISTSPTVSAASCGGQSWVSVDLVHWGVQASHDCNGNGSLDACDILGGDSTDLDSDGTPDDCQSDCNENGTPDLQEIAAGAPDVDGDLVLDACEPDCDADAKPDDWEIATGQEADCNGNDVPDSCDIADGLEKDCNGNGFADSCEIEGGVVTDKDTDGIPDDCEYALGDFDLDGTVGPVDLGFVLALWGVLDPPVGDLDGDGIVGGGDLAAVLANWGPITY